MKAQISIVSMLVLFALVLTACTTAPLAATSAPVEVHSTAVSATDQPVSSTVSVNIKGFAFDPSELSIKTGTTVTWTNQDGVNHTVTSDTGLFDSGELGKGSTFSYTFTKAGVYTYYCIPHHQNMKASVTVTD